MSEWLVGIFSLLVAAAGWYYLFYSRAAQRLSGIENQDINQRRVRLRRIGGAVMMLLAVSVFAGVFTVQSPRSFVAVWLMVLALLGAIVVLALMDLRLTIKLRRRKRDLP